MFDLAILSHWAGERPDAFAFIDSEYMLTFSELNSMVRKTATLLRKDGVKAGDLVSVHLPSYLEWTTCLALHGLGATVCSLAETKKPNRDILPDWIIGLESMANPINAPLLIFDESKFETIKREEEIATFPGYSNGSDLARLYSTSGTTGEVKYLSLTSHELENRANRSGTHDFFGEDPLLSLFPLTMGISYGRALKALINGKTYLSCEFNDYRLPKVLLKYSIRSLVASPSKIANFLDMQLQTGTQLPDLKAIIVCGSPPSTKLISRIRSQLDCKIFDDYGSTEVGNAGLRELTVEGGGGFIINPSVTLEIVDETDTELPSGRIGRVRYKRSGMSASYFNNPSASLKMFRDGFFYPGDSGYLSDKNELVLSGRTDYVLNLGGRKLNPEVVEEVAMSQLGVVDCVAYSYNGDSGVDLLALAIVTNSEFDSQLFEKVMRMKSPVVPSSIVLVKYIPRNGNGKIERDQIQASYRRSDGQNS